ncbi:MAG: glycerol kinase, partial [Pseudomonadota bacterium]
MPTTTPLFLCIDQGGHASRALIIDARGVVCARAERPVTTRQPKPDWVEHDAEELVDSVRAAMEETLRALGPNADRIVAAGLATQRSSIVCWDRAGGAALSPVISWQDRRAHAWLKQFTPHQRDVHARTGLMLSAHYGASK